MVIAALIAFAGLFVAWLAAPNRNGVLEAVPLPHDLTPADTTA